MALPRRGNGQGPARRRRDRPQSNRQSQKGAKRSLLCEASGIPVGLATAGANRNDHKLLTQTLASIPIPRPKPSAERPQGLCLDKGYDYPGVREQAEELGFVVHLRSRDEEAAAKRADPDWRARRWVVERSHAWLNRNRGLLIRWSKKPENHRALHHLAFGILAWKRVLAVGLPG